jgi:hypothetical protein
MSLQTLLLDQCSFDNVFDNDYTQLVTPRTHVISDSDNVSDEEQKEIVNVGLGAASNKFAWENTRLISHFMRNIL